MPANGAEVIRVYLRQYPEASNAAVVRAVTSLHPGLFANDESARKTIRQIRKHEIEFKFQTPENRRTPQNYPEPDTFNQVRTYHFGEDNRNILVIADLHMPFYERNAVELALEYGYKKDVDTILILGDLLDFHSISRFLINPQERNLKHELDMGIEFLSALRDQFPNADIKYKLGNHELWWERYVWTNAPLISDIADMSFREYLCLTDFDIDVIEDKQDIRICQNLSAIHGHEIRGGSADFPARGIMNRFRENVIAGHWHKPSHFSVVTGTGKVHGAWSLGCLCQLRPEYLPINSWILGFAHITTDGVDFELDNKQIIKGKILSA